MLRFTVALEHEVKLTLWRSSAKSSSHGSIAFYGEKQKRDGGRAGDKGAEGKRELRLNV